MNGEARCERCGCDFGHGDQMVIITTATAPPPGERVIRPDRVIVFCTTCAHPILTAALPPLGRN